MDRCSVCPGINTCVAPTGPCDAEIMLIGEAPGRDEDRKGIPFIGKTGQELNEHYLPLAGLRRDNVYVTNAIKCLPTGHSGKLDANRSKDMRLLYGCSGENLYEELRRVKPRLIVAMGAFACRAIDADIELDASHGHVVETSFGIVMPMYHPAGGIHEPKKMLQIRTDWYRLGKYLKGKLRENKDEYPKPDYQEDKDAGYNYYQTHRFTSGSAMACDTEITRFGEPYCLTYSIQEGTGMLIRAENTTSLKAFQHKLDVWTGPILFHNFLFDKKVVEAMGLRFPEHLITDTMVRAFHLGNLPQGLKTLAYRELGIKMEDFDDLVTPYSTPLCLDYLSRASGMVWPRPDEELIRDSGGSWKLYSPQSISTKLKRFHTDLRNDPGKDPYRAWENWSSEHAMIEAVMGPWPGKDIRYAPFDKVLTYACRDADATLRLYQREQQMTRNVRRTTQERWGE